MSTTSLCGALLIGIATLGAGCAADATDELARDVGDGPPDIGARALPFTATRLLVEYDATVGLAAVRAVVDGTAWSRVDVYQSDGKPVLAMTTDAKLRGLGLDTAGLVSEAAPLRELMIAMRPDLYTVRGRSADGQAMYGLAKLSYALPRAPGILEPAADVEVSPYEDLRIVWKPVTAALDGAILPLSTYQVTVTRLGIPAEPFAGAERFSVSVPRGPTEMILPSAFLRPGAKYAIEVAAVAWTGNRTTTSVRFTTK